MIEDPARFPGMITSPSRNADGAEQAECSIGDLEQAVARAFTRAWANAKRRWSQRLEFVSGAG